MAEQLAQRQSRRLHRLPPDSPPAMEGQEGVTMERLASAEAHMETTLATEPREDFLVYDNPLVQLTPEAAHPFTF